MGNELDGKKPKLSRVEKREQRRNRVLQVKKRQAAAEADSESTSEVEESSATAVVTSKPSKKKPSQGIFARLIESERRPLDGMSLLRWHLTPVDAVRQAVKEACKTIKVLWLMDGLNIVVGTQKGGAGKSSLVAALSTTLAWVTQVAVGVFNFNPYGEHIADRLGVKRGNVTFGSLLDDPSPLNDHESMSRNVGNHPDRGLHSVYVIPWNKKKGGKEKRALAEQEVKPISEVLSHSRKAYHSTLIDLGNPLYTNWTIAAIQFDPRRSVVMIPFTPHQENSQTDAFDSFEEYCLHDPSVEDRCIIVVSAYKGRKSQELIDQCAEETGLPKSRIAVVPFDEVFVPLNILDEEGKLKVRVVNPKRFKIRTLLANLKLLILAARVSADFRIKYPDNVELPTALEATSGPKAIESSDLDPIEEIDQPQAIAVGDTDQAQGEIVSPELVDATISP